MGQSGRRWHFGISDIGQRLEQTFFTYVRTIASRVVKATLEGRPHVHVQSEKLQLAIPFLHLGSHTMDDEDDKDSGELPVNRDANVTRDEALTTVEDLESAQRQFDAAKLARDFANSSTQQAIKKAAADIAISEMLRLATKPLTDLKANLAATRVTTIDPANLSPLGAVTPSFVPPVITRQAAADLAYSEMMRRALDPLASVTANLAANYPMASELVKIPSLSASVSPIPSSMMKAMRAIQPPVSDLGIDRTMQAVRKSWEDAFRPLSDIQMAIGKIEEQQSSARKALVASLAGPIGDIVKVGQWANAINRISSPDVAALFGRSLAPAVDDARSALMRTLTAPIVADQVRMTALLGLDSRFSAEFDATRLKMSMFAAIGETSDQRSSLRAEAYHSLFGTWRSRPDLPENFFRDTRVRERMYREAEVDDGLITASPGVALEIMIESGLTPGLRSDVNAVAVFTLGEVSMTVRSGDTRKDAYAALERFEEEMRAYITRKLEERMGPDWFKERASNLMGKAKETRKAAMQRGEGLAPLIEFVDLGDLAGIILSKKNWDEVYGWVAPAWSGPCWLRPCCWYSSLNY